jgi:cholest-4-en-3-one 26-monooxygenase
VRSSRAKTISSKPCSGRGPHQCLGKHVAALEMKILLEEQLQRTKDITPAGDINYVRDAFSGGVYQLPVTIAPA